MSVALGGTLLCSCTSARSKKDEIALAPFIDTYRWHPYHLTKDAPTSSDGRFRLVGVTKEGNIELIDLTLDARIVVKRSTTTDELIASRMPMRVVKFDFDAQSADFEWLTTN